MHWEGWDDGFGLFPFWLKEYEVCVTTGDANDADTKENAWIVLEGKKGQSKQFVMENSSKKKRFSR